MQVQFTNKIKRTVCFIVLIFLVGSGCEEQHDELDQSENLDFPKIISRAKEEVFPALIFPINS